MRSTAILLVPALAQTMATAEAVASNNVSWFATTSAVAWQRRAVRLLSTRAQPACADYGLFPTGGTAQTIDGFGACFNELGWDALQSLPEAERATQLKDFWHPSEGMGLVYNRVPVGGNDYADGWYSHDEMPPGQQDLEMKHFSVSRDEKKLIPYIVAAQGQMGSGGGGRKQHLFASAWSPPMWMKQNHNFSGCSNGTCSKANPDGCNAGKDGNPPNAMIQDPAGRVLGAYAHYLSLFVSAYKSHGIDVTAMMVQNEPYATGCNYPKCEWTGEQMRDFIHDHAGPRFEQDHNGSCMMWLGTLNTFDFLECPNTVLSDIATKRFVGGAALQWAGKDMVERVHQTWPDLPLIQSENECGDGSNTYDYAIYIFDLMRHYLGNGVRGYTYWNPILATPNGSSTWGWQQNSMVSVIDGHARRNPEFYVFSHYARFIQPGAVRLEVSGDWSGSAIAARNPDGQVAVVVMNPHTADRKFVFRTHGLDGSSAFMFEAELEPRSFNSFLVPKV